MIGSMNRGGLQGATFELDDRFTGYTAAEIEARGLEGGKMLTRICLDDPGTVATLEASGHAVTELAQRRLMAMVEPFLSVRGWRPRAQPARPRQHHPVDPHRVRPRRQQRPHLAQAAGGRRPASGSWRPPPCPPCCSAATPRATRRTRTRPGARPSTCPSVRGLVVGPRPAVPARRRRGRRRSTSRPSSCTEPADDDDAEVGAAPRRGLVARGATSWSTTPSRTGSTPGSGSSAWPPARGATYRRGSGSTSWSRSPAPRASTYAWPTVATGWRTWPDAPRCSPGPTDVAYAPAGSALTLTGSADGSRIAVCAARVTGAASSPFRHVAGGRRPGRAARGGDRLPRGPQLRHPRGARRGRDHRLRGDHARPATGAPTRRTSTTRSATASRPSSRRSTTSRPRSRVPRTARRPRRRRPGRLPAGLRHRRPPDRRVRRGAHRRRGARAARLARAGDGGARLRPLLPQRDGRPRPGPGLADLRRPQPRAGSATPGRTRTIDPRLRAREEAR